MRGFGPCERGSGHCVSTRCFGVKNFADEKFEANLLSGDCPRSSNTPAVGPSLTCGSTGKDLNGKGKRGLWGGAGSRMTVIAGKHLTGQGWGTPRRRRNRLVRRFLRQKDWERVAGDG